MVNRRVSDVARYIVSRKILVESADLLRSLSGGLRESVVLWAGTARGREATVRRIVVPRQFSSAYHFDVPLGERLRIAQEFATSGEQLLVQLHTHPGQAFHSPIDDRRALPRHTGALSIVVEKFAAKWHGNLREVSVNRHIGEGVWSELSPKAVSLLFEVR